MRRRLFSIWSWARVCYDYYATPSLLDDDQVPRAPTSRDDASSLGVAPHELLRALPSGALYVGSGLVPRGELGRAPTCR
jgi:hypothetical protein